VKKVFLTERGPKAVGPYSTAVIQGETAYLSGMLPIDPSTGKLAEGIGAQARQALTNVKTVLEEMGLSLSHLLKVSIFMTDLANFSEVNAIYGEFLEIPFPARSCVQVAALPMGAMIEIEAIAATRL
jgi:2-iminobutanoate/2-iminopropanoate deaminase